MFLSNNLIVDLSAYLNLPKVDVVRLNVGLRGGRGHPHVLVAGEVEHGGRPVARRAHVACQRAVARGPVPALAARAAVLAGGFRARRCLGLTAGEDRT